MAFDKFEIILVSTETKDTFHDVSFCSFIRTPIIKQASYCILKINLTPIIIKQILNDISLSKNPKFNLSIFLINDDVEKHNSARNRVKTIFEKNYLVLGFELEDKFEWTKQSISCRMILINPLLYYLNNNNTYNKIHENIKALDIISDFESFLTSKFGDTFYYNHIGDNIEKNEYIYEQVLVKPKNDINVPTQIINTYKPNNFFTYYFFDDFYINDTSDKDITNHYINLYDKDQLTKFNIYDSNDEIVQGLKKIDSVPLSDSFIDLNKENVSYNINHMEINFKEKKETTASVPQQNTISNDSEEFVEYRKYNKTKSDTLNTPENKKTIPQSSQHDVTFSPDTVDNAKSRLKIAKELFNKKIKNIVSYECTNCLPDWVQPGYLYNFELDEQTSFVHTPLNIINTFIRKNSKEHYLYHVVKFNCFEYYKDYDF